jgi:hypothetical protein
MARIPGTRYVLRLTAVLAVMGTTLALIPAAHAQVPFADADFSAYATGTILHTDLLQLGATRLVDAELGFAGASTASKGLGTQVVNELGQVTSPVIAGKNSYGRGSGLEVGLAQTVPTVDNALILSQKAEASAPPSTDLVTKQTGPINLPPVAFASLLKGQAQARWDPAGCILGQDISYGVGNAADVQLLGPAGDLVGGLLNSIVATSASTPNRGVSQTTTRTRLVPQTNKDGQPIGGDLGIMSQVRQTLAPITLFKGIPGAELTIEFLGEWVLTATASGKPGGAYVHYGPGTASPSTPVLRILGPQTAPAGAPAGSLIPPLGGLVLTLQQLLGPTGLQVDNLLGLVDIAIGEDPRAIGGGPTTAPTEDPNGTVASGAVDVVRVRLLPGATGLLGGLTQGLLGGLQLADIRIGHMEAKAVAPAGGIKCPGIGVRKESNPENVTAGNGFDYAVHVDNPYDCPLTDVKLTDTVTTDGPTFVIGAATPTESSRTASQLVFNDIGPIPAHGTKDVGIKMSVPSDSKGGFLFNEAKADANCGLETGIGDTKVNVALHGEVKIQKPQVAALAQPNLPRTGGPSTAWFMAWAAALGALSAGLLWSSRKLSARAKGS